MPALSTREDIFMKRSDTLRRAMERSSISAFLITDLINIRYMIDLDCSFGYLLCMKGKRYFITDGRYTSDARENASGVEVVEYKGGNKHTIGEIIMNIIRSHNIKKLGFEPDVMTVQEYNSIRKKMKKIKFVPQRNVIESMRIVKDEFEIDRISEACRKTDKAFRSLVPQLKPGMTEREIRLLLDSELIAQKIEKPAFDTIVASGPNGAHAHAKPSTRKIRKGDFIVMDFGVRVDGYHSDMTRTVLVGKPGSEDRRCYNAVNDARQQAFDAAKKGVETSLLDSIAREVLAESGLADRFIHGLGHGVGLDVHELPRLSPVAKDIMKTGMVFTVEPGVYIEGWGGIRIEDTCVLTKSGPVSLTKSSHSLISI